MCLNYGRGPCISAHKTANPINTDQNHISNRFQPTKDADHKEIRCYPANFNKFLDYIAVELQTHSVNFGSVNVCALG